MRAVIAKLAIVLLTCAALSGCAAYDKLVEMVKGPSCYGGEEAVVGKCQDDRVPGGDTPGWWRVSNVRVNGQDVMYSVTNVPGAVWLPSELLHVLDKQYAYKGIAKVVRYSNIDIVLVWVSDTCDPGIVVNGIELFPSRCGSLFLEDSDFTQMTPELAKQLLSVDTVTQLELRASSAKRDIVYALGIVKNK